jgi:hypothetical protein
MKHGTRNSAQAHATELNAAPLRSETRHAIGQKIEETTNLLGDLIVKKAAPEPAGSFMTIIHDAIYPPIRYATSRRSHRLFIPAF